MGILWPYVHLVEVVCDEYKLLRIKRKAFEMVSAKHRVRRISGLFWPIFNSNLCVWRRGGGLGVPTIEWS